jgi:translation initiation factor IF-1
VDVSPPGGSSSSASFSYGGAIAVREEKVEVTGEVVEAPRSGMYRVALDGGRHELLAHTAGKMRKFRIRIVVGDEVRVEKWKVHYVRVAGSTRLHREGGRKNLRALPR